MMMKWLMVLAAVMLSSSVMARDVSELSAPIVLLTPVVGQNADALALSPQQRQVLRDWVNTAPAKRMAVEDEVVVLRAKLREAIYQGSPQAERESLAQRIGELETRLLMIRSQCVEHWRSHLSAEQFAKAVALAKQR